MKQTSNIKVITGDLAKRLRDIADLQTLQREIANYLYGSNIRRIHMDGRAEDGSPIGSYSTDPLYVNPERSPKKFTPRGKKGETANFKNGKKRKTAYFAQGYKGFRGAIGRPVDKVNLQLSSKLKLSWAMGSEGKDYVVGFTSDYGAKVSAGQEKHFGKTIWGVSADDQIAVDTLISRFIDSKLGA